MCSPNEKVCKGKCSPTFGTVSLTFKISRGVAGCLWLGGPNFRGDSVCECVGVCVFCLFRAICDIIIVTFLWSKVRTSSKVSVFRCIAARGL